MVCVKLNIWGRFLKEFCDKDKGAVRNGQTMVQISKKVEDFDEIRPFSTHSGPFLFNISSFQLKKSLKKFSKIPTNSN